MTYLEIWEQEKIRREKMRSILGNRIAGCLIRGGINSIEELKYFIKKYPSYELSRKNGSWIRGIGPIYYQEIINILNSKD